MKRFVTLLTVSITMAGLALADHPVVEPEVGGGIGLPFNPSEFITTSSTSNAVWSECFCTGVPNYTEFPAFGDPTIRNHMMQMNGYGSVPTYLQSPTTYNYDGFVLDMNFWLGMDVCAESFGYYITPTALSAAPTAAVLASGLSFIFNRTSTTSADVTVYDDGAYVATASLPIDTRNLYNYRVIYDEYGQRVKIVMYDMVDEIPVLGWTAVTGPSAGSVGFGGISTQGCYQFIDQICLYVNTNDEYEVGNVEGPASYQLAQNFPNPFNPTTTINFTMPATGEASLKVYDLAGHVVATLVDGMVTSGEHNVVFDGGNLSSGVYFYTFEAEGVSQTYKMVLAK